MTDDLTLQLPSGSRLQTSWLLTAAGSTLDEEIRLIRQYLYHISQRRNCVNSSLLRLPTELICLIMDELVEISRIGSAKPSPQRDLQCCSLVCSALLPYARARLLPCLRLDNPDTFLNAVRMFKDVLPELRPQPRVVDMRDGWEETEYWKLTRTTDGTQWGELRASIVPMLQGLTSITQLRINRTEYAADQPTLLLSASGQLTVPTWSHISYLTLQECGFDGMRTLLNLVLQFPSLAVLELLYCCITNDGSAHLDPGPRSQKLALRRLQVEQINRPGILSAEDCMLALSKYTLPDSLHELECDVPETADRSPALRDVIGRFGASLQDIHFHSNPTVEDALPQYADLIADILAPAPNVRSVTQTLSQTDSAALVDCIVSILEHTHLANLNSISTLIPGILQMWFHITSSDTARIARATRSRVRIALDERVLPLSMVPDEDWQQRHRKSSSVIRHVEGRSFVVAQDVYEFEGEGGGRVLVYLERTEMDGSMTSFHALEFVRCDPSLG